MKNWDDLRFFAAVARGGSLLAAARALGVNAATVSRRIDRLEAALGRGLFLRTNSGYLLNADGERILRHAEALESEIYDLGHSAAEGEALRGSVTVTLTEALADGFLIPLLPRLHALHPGLTIDLLRDDRSLDLSRREADIALRLARPQQGGLKTRKLGVLTFGLYAGADYLQSRGTPTDPEQLAGHDIIWWIEDYAGLGSLSWWHRAAMQQPVFRSNAPSCRRAAALAGLGIVLLPHIMVGPGVPLQPILPQAEVPSLEIWLVVHRDLARQPRIRASLDFIAAAARRNPILSGKAGAS